MKKSNHCNPKGGWRHAGDYRQPSTGESISSCNLPLHSLFPPSQPVQTPPPLPPPPGGGACLLAHKRHLKAMREQEPRWQPMPEGEWQAYRLFLPLHGSMQHSLCQRGEGPVLVGGDGEMSGGLILCNCLVYGPSGHI